MKKAALLGLLTALSGGDSRIGCNRCGQIYGCRECHELGGKHKRDCSLIVAIRDLEAEITGERHVCAVCGCSENDACVDFRFDGTPIACAWIASPREYEVCGFDICNVCARKLAEVRVEKSIPALIRACLEKPKLPKPRAKRRAKPKTAKRARR